MLAYFTHLHYIFDYDMYFCYVFMLIYMLRFFMIVSP